MRIVVISPESADPREAAAMEGLFVGGLEFYHVRKPAWSAADLEAWLGRLPRAWRPRIILHGHPALAGNLGLGGWHEGDRGDGAATAGFSRSCHDLPSLRRHLAAHRAILFGPVFPSITKPGYGPRTGFPWDELASLLKGDRAKTGARVLAIGGVTAAGLVRCRELGFDGAAVMGAVWSEPDPVGAYAVIRDAAARLEAERHAA